MYDVGAGVNGKTFRANFLKNLSSVLQVEEQDAHRQTDTQLA
jgi:hypothetical protein